MPKLILNENEENVEKENQTVVKHEQEDKKVPSCYIEIKLPSNGRIENYPKVLHFRDYTSSDIVDLNIRDDGDLKTLTKVLSRMNYEGYDVSNLVAEDLLYITYILHSTFVSNTIEKKEYIDDTLEDGTDEGQLDNKENIEIFEIPISSLKYTVLGYDENGNKIDVKFKSPFTITDTKTNDKIGVRLPTIKDVQIATEYVKNKYEDEFIKYDEVKTAMEKLHSKKNNDEEIEKYYRENKTKIEEYYSFYKEFLAVTAKITSALRIVSFNGKPIDNIEEKLRLYSENISIGVWSAYDNIIEKFRFGINSEQEVFSERLNKKITKTFQFQLDDFIPSNDRKESDRFTMSFD